MEPCLAGGRIVVGIDFSDSCEQALLHAVARAEQERKELELVHVFEWDGPGAADAARINAGANAGAAQPELRILTQAARTRLAKLCSSLVGDRVAAEIRVLVGDPALELCRAAQGAGASSLVIGAGGRSLSQGAAGSTARRVCRSSQVPVLLVDRNPTTGAEQLLLGSARGRVVGERSRSVVRRRVAAGQLQSGTLG